MSICIGCDTPLESESLCDDCLEKLQMFGEILKANDLQLTRTKSKDRVLYDSFLSSETWFECEIHKVPYPKGAKCPACDD